MVSELASNAVQHARSSFSVSIDETQDGIRVEVRDSGGGTPVVGAPTFRDVSGRGLLIVKSLSQEFGIDQTTVGKAVWFRLSTDSTAGPRRARSSGRQHDR
jgi:anti-sigma regulatory factor (Ser/Thr protein kinase)